MNTKLVILSLTACLLSLGLTACDGGTVGSDTQDFPSLGSGGSSGSVPLPADPEAEAASISPLFIAVQTLYDGPGNEETQIQTHGYCYIDPTNLAANDINCTIKIPEGWLFYSKMFLTLGTGNATACPRVEFFPYYRRLSNLAAYTPRGADTPLDCTKSTEIGCYDGAAVDIVPEFPKSTGIWFPTTVVSSMMSTVKSSWSLDSKYGNLHTCNNLGAGSRAADMTQGGFQVYQGGTMVDYTVKCMDRFQGTLFKITMTIEDEDTVNAVTDAVNDEFYDWN